MKIYLFKSNYKLKNEQGNNCDQFTKKLRFLDIFVANNCPEDNKRLRTKKQDINTIIKIFLLFLKHIN